jgi:hypothetical protein
VTRTTTTRLIAEKSPNLNSRKNLTLKPKHLQFLRKTENDTIRVVIDFRKLNLLLKCHPFPIAKIGDMIRSMKGFTFASALDLNMGYYHLKTDADADNHKQYTTLFAC